MEIEVRPGLVSKDSEGKITCRPIFSRIVSLFAEQNELQFAVPGGLIGVYVVFSLQILLLNTIFSSKFGSIFNPIWDAVPFFTMQGILRWIWIGFDMVNCSLFTF